WQPTAACPRSTSISPEGRSASCEMAGACSAPSTIWAASTWAGAVRRFGSPCSTSASERLAFAAVFVRSYGMDLLARLDLSARCLYDGDLAKSEDRVSGTACKGIFVIAALVAACSGEGNLQAAHDGRGSQGSPGGGGSNAAALCSS